LLSLLDSWQLFCRRRSGVYCCVECILTRSYSI
jgi:hypothetical protein